MEDTLPKSGLPTHPAAFNFDLDEDGNISGLGKRRSSAVRSKSITLRFCCGRDMKYPLPSETVS